MHMIKPTKITTELLDTYFESDYDNVTLSSMIACLKDIQSQNWKPEYFLEHFLTPLEDAFYADYDTINTDGLWTQSAFIAYVILEHFSQMQYEYYSQKAYEEALSSCIQLCVQRLQDLEKPLLERTLCSAEKESYLKYHYKPYQFLKTDDIQKECMRQFAKELALLSNQSGLEILGYESINESELFDRNISTAITCFKILYEDYHDSEYAYMLGRIYQDYAEDDLDYQRAFYYLSIAQDHTSCDAMMRKGDLYRNGLGVVKNLYAARQLYEAAYKEQYLNLMNGVIFQQFAEAAYRMGELELQNYYAGFEDEHLKKARTYYLQALAGDPDCEMRQTIEEALVVLAQFYPPQASNQLSLSELLNQSSHLELRFKLSIIKTDAQDILLNVQSDSYLKYHFLPIVDDNAILCRRLVCRLHHAKVTGFDTDTIDCTSMTEDGLILDHDQIVGSIEYEGMEILQIN